MNTEYQFRPLFLERRADVYASVGAILLPWLSVRCGIGKWNRKAFERAPFESADPARVEGFLAERRAHIDALLPKVP